MKSQMMECTRSLSQWRQRWLMSVAAVLLLFVPFSHAQVFGPPVSAERDAILPPIGGTGGSQYIARCPPEQLLTGVALQTGDDVDSIHPICVIAYGPEETKRGNPLPKFPKPRPAYSLPIGLFLVNRQLLCPREAPVVIGMYVRSEGRKTVIVNNVHFWCGQAAPVQERSEHPNAVFDGPTHAWEGPKGRQDCPAGFVAVGIHGKSGIWVDSLGLICGEPTLTSEPAGPKAGFTLPRPAKPVMALGRVKVPPADPSAEPVSICESARRARARNSPAAPGLEAQCRAVGETPPPAFEPIDADAIADFAARGEVIANADPLSAELRSREAEGPSRRGFDIGMAAAEGHTAPGPGKQRTHDSLSPAEQKGFSRALAFSLERNKNAALASTGAAIADADPIVAEARTSDTDVFYWLGFDIATGIFGDPALGARGNTATGPGSLRTRDSLSAPGQRGFNASVALHLSRRY